MQNNPFNQQQQQPFGNNNQQQDSFQPQYQQQNQQQQPGQGFNNIIDQQMGGVLGSIAKDKATGFLKNANLDASQITGRIFNANSKYYFDVDSKYVLNKLKLIVIPFLQRSDWSKTESEHGDGHQGFLSPVQEIHSPDQYIPLMGLMTFILIGCLSLGIGESFQPSIIQSNLTKCIFISIIELFIFKLAFFLINIRQSGFIESCLDLSSHLNYRYVQLTLILILNLTLGNFIAFVALLYLFACSFYFVYKTLQRYQTSTGEEETKNKVFLILSGIQIIFSYILLKITGAY